MDPTISHASTQRPGRFWTILCHTVLFCSCAYLRYVVMADQMSTITWIFLSVSRTPWQCEYSQQYKSNYCKHHEILTGITELGACAYYTWTPHQEYLVARQVYGAVGTQRPASLSASSLTSLFSSSSNRRSLQISSSLSPPVSYHRLVLVTF